MESLQQAEAAPEVAEKGWRCCCMCGDVGFSENLLQCPVCCFRVQHTYCSSMYPKTDVGRWLCEWCLHGDRRKLQEMEDLAPAKKHKGLHVAANDMMTLTTKKLHRIEEGDVGDAGSSNPQRRCKPKCNVQSPRRRYRLLADVLM